MTHLEVAAILTILAAWVLAVDWVWRNRHLFQPNPPIEQLLGAGPAAIDDEDLWTPEDDRELARLLQDFL